MIAVERKGRLGNQLFQFAFGIAASSTLGTSFVMEDEVPRGVFTLGRWGSPAGAKVRRLRFRVGHRLRPYPIVDEVSFADPEQALAGVRDRRIYTGYFQSERYFSPVADEVCSAFSFLPEHEHRFQARYGDLAGTPYVCCHVRRTDFHDWEGGIVLPASYYLDSLAELGWREGVPVVFVGDDFEDLRKELAVVRGAHFEQNDEALDLLLMVHAAGVVTSNSSFAWWGAYLNRATDTRVVAPRYWLGFKEHEEQPRHVLPDRWRQITVAATNGAARG